MIEIRQRLVPRSRTHTGSLWEASTEIGGKPDSATSRHGAPQALARALVAAGIPDQPVEVRSEVCVFDDSAEIRSEVLRGCIRYRSLHAMAKTTFEEGDRPLHRARFKERPQIARPLPPGRQEMRFTLPAGILASDGLSDGLDAGGGTGQKCVSSAATYDLETRPAGDHEAGSLTSTAATRRCGECDGDFLAARRWSRFCSPACRLRAHRRSSLGHPAERVAVALPEALSGPDTR
jgi:hypothetical protein